MKNDPDQSKELFIHLIDCQGKWLEKNQVFKKRQEEWIEKEEEFKQRKKRNILKDGIKSEMSFQNFVITLSEK